MDTPFSTTDLLINYQTMTTWACPLEANALCISVHEPESIMDGYQEVKQPI